MNTKIKFLFIPLLLFSFIIKSYADCSSPTNINAFIGNIPNGTNHYLIINWEAVQNATLYKIEYSQNNINWFELNVSANISYEHNCGDNPNTPYYYRVSASVDGFNFCTPNNCKQFPIYTACDFPQISISNPTGSSLKVNILNETPVANPDYTTYSIYCVTLAKYIQTDGSAGTDEIFLTKEQWQALSFTGLQKETQYCFYAKARNMDGDLRFKLSSSSIYNTESFSTSAKFSTDGSGPTNRFWSPSTCGGSSGIGGLIYNASKGCDGGAIGIEKSWNNYFGCFLRTPYINCSNYDYVTMTLDLTTSARAKDYIRFYYWDVAYKHTVSSIKINGVESLSSFGANGNGFYYTTALTCAKVEVTFDLRNAANKNQILFYIEPECGYNDGQVFKTWIDNVGIVSESIESVCGTTTK
ncbi:MAG: hypothetical protein KA792_09110, partial [Bacteroidales bacterium]|nr:hypothetical protein [Bacteroidales bacterium]